MAENVIKQGWLHKKSPKGYKGYRWWQKRFIVLDMRHISYYKDEQQYIDIKQPTGVIRIDQILKCEYLAERRVGSRFDVYSKSGRDFQFHGKGISEARQWVEAVMHTMDEAKRSLLEAKEGDVFDENTSQFRKAFLVARYGKLLLQADLDENDSNRVKAIMEEANKEFPDEAAILHFILKEIMDVSKGHLHYDTGGDAAVREAEEKEKRAEQVEQERTAVRGSSAKYVELVEWIITKDAVRLLSEQFSSENLEVHQMALRCLWVIFRVTLSPEEAAQAFSSRLAIHCSGQFCNTRIKDALLHILLSDPNDVAVADLKPLRIGFHVKVRQPSTWLPLFAVLANTHHELRLAVLQDVNTVLLDNHANCITLLQYPSWQNWILALLLDLPAAERNQEPVKSLYQFVLNVPSLILILELLHSDQMEKELLNCFNKVFLYGGQTQSCLKLASQLMTVLAMKTIRAAKNDFNDFAVPGDEDEEEDKQFEWENLTKLLRFIKRFVFQSSFLINNEYRDRLIAEEELSSQSDRHSKKLATPIHGHGGTHSYGGRHSSTVTIDFVAMESPNGTSQTLDQNRNKLLYDIRGENVPEEWLITRTPPFKGCRTYESSFQTSDNCLHWDLQGEAMDLELVKQVVAMMKAFKFQNYDGDCMGGTVSKGEREYMQAMFHEYEFWVDSATMMQTITRADIEEKHAYTYRKLSHVLGNWVTAGAKERQTITKWFVRKREKAHARSASETTEILQRPHTNDFPDDEK